MMGKELLPLIDHDFAIIGAGLVGLASAHEIVSRYPSAKVVVLEKEDQVATHQSGRNSGVLHAGVYYQPGSLKATLCRAGKKKLEHFCDEEGISYKRIGKVIVAVDEDERPGLMKILDRAKANGIECSLIDANRLREIEPSVTGVAAVHVPESGIIDFPGVAKALVKRIESKGGTVSKGSEVISAVRRNGVWILNTLRGDIQSKFVINCGGLHSDRMARILGIIPQVQIVPFRGEYWLLKDEKKDLCRSLIYPVPDPAFPFLGVHLTRMISGHVECGPNAVLALAREGYSWGKLDIAHLASLAAFPGFLRFAWKHLGSGIGEIVRSLSKKKFASAVRRLVPEVQDDDLIPGGAGVRAQAMTLDGKLCDDFALQKGEGALHVLNAPSPAATACLAIGKHIVDQLNP